MEVHSRFDQVWIIFATVTIVRENKIQISLLLIHCLFEAQIEFDYVSAYGTNEVLAICYANPMDRYALGYCIASTISWGVELYIGFVDSLIWGLKSTPICNGFMNELTLTECSLNLASFQQCPISLLQKITCVRFNSCRYDILESIMQCSYQTFFP